MRIIFELWFVNELFPEGLKMPRRPWFSSSWYFWMIKDKSLRSILGKKNESIFGIISFLSVEVIALGTFQTLSSVFSVLCYVQSLKSEIHTGIVDLARLFGWCNRGHRNMWEVTMQVPQHRELGNSRHVEHSSGQKEMVTFALGSCPHFRVVNQTKRGGETGAAVQLQCPTSALKKSRWLLKPHLF